MKALFTKVDFKDIIVRLTKTFIQASLAVFIASFANGIDITNKEAMSALGIAALAAGLSAVMNFVKEALK
ncbi:MAG: hypothetical protein KAX49_07175 [Halanaerobiales bacterium]|nr:hypothetical protein [Halanaerobiales bacterium]